MLSNRIWFSIGDSIVIDGAVGIDSLDGTSGNGMINGVGGGDLLVAGGGFDSLFSVLA